MKRWIGLIAPLIGLLVYPSALAAKGDGPPTGQKELVRWWRAAQDLLRLSLRLRRAVKHHRVLKPRHRSPQ